MLAAFESIPRADRVIVALDCPRAKALDLAVALQGKAKWLKIGMTLYTPKVLPSSRSSSFWAIRCFST